MKSPKVLLIVMLVLAAGLVHSLKPSVAFAQTAAAAARVSEFRDYMQLRDGHKIWVEAEIIDPSLPTKWIFNGLTNSTRSFDIMSSEFRKQGYNVIRFDFLGQAGTLRGNKFEGDFSFMAQVAVVKELAPMLQSKFRLTGGFDVLGQSYGGGILLAVASYEPEFAKRYFRTISVYAPFTEALRAQHEQILQEIKTWRTVYPTLNYTDAELYDLIFYRTVMSSYWLFEPEIMGANLAETRLNLKGVYELARGIRPFDAVKVVGNLPANMKINVIISASDQYIPGDVIPRYWDALPLQNRGYFVEVFGTEHKMFQVIPRFSASLEELTTKPVKQIPLGSKMEAYQVTDRLHVGKDRYILDDLISPTGKDAVASRLKGKSAFSIPGVKCEGVFAQ